MQKVYDYIAEHKQESLDTLCTLIRQPSISNTGEGILECAQLLKGMMEDAGITTRIMPTKGHPVVYGEITSDRNAPTVLIYGHYDVQPVDPIELWQSPPFEPTFRDGRIYARGSGDNKGQLMAHVQAIKALKATNSLPNINVKFLFDGEEEGGSPNLPEFLAEHRDLFKADVAYSSDGPMHESGRPVVFFGVRGLLYVQLDLQGANKDVHSGNKGGVVPNPAWEMIQLLATMRDAEGRCTIEGFYDAVLPPTEFERKLLDEIPYDEAEFLQDMNLAKPGMRQGLGYWESLQFQPTFNICGFGSGYQGPGSKTIIPSHATVKMDMRLVANQDPEDIYQKFVNHVKKHNPNVKITQLGTYLPSRTPAELPVCKKVMESVRKAYDPEEPVIWASLGGSTPDYILTKHLGLPSIWVPYAGADENNHAPNENIKIKDYMGGIRATATVLTDLAVDDWRK